MAMDKYGTPREVLDRLLELGIVKTEEEGLEKVASGEAAQLLAMSSYAQARRKAAADRTKRKRNEESDDS